MEFTEHIEEIDFQKYWLVLKRRWIPATATFLTVFALALYAALSRETVYKAEAQILIKRTDKSADLTGLDRDLGDIQSLAGEPLYTEVAILRSRPITEKVKDELGIPGISGKHLEAEPITGTDILRVTYEDPDPELAAAVVNKIIHVYKDSRTSSNRDEATAALKFITEQLPEVEATVSKAEADLRRFKTKNRIANLSQETTRIIGTINSQETQIHQLSVQLEDINARSEILRKQLGLSLEEATAVSSLSQSAAVQGVLTELQGVKVELANERNRFSENHPQILSLKEREAQLNTLLEKGIRQTLGNQQIAALKNLNIFSIGRLKQEQIIEFANLEVERSGLSSRLAALKNIHVAHKQRLDLLPALEEKQRELERRLEAAQSTYKTLLNNMQETRVTENQNVGNVRIISDALVPGKPSNFKEKILIGAAGGVAGVFLGIAVAFLLDLTDKSVKTIKEAEEIFIYPLQGVIPSFELVKKTSKLSGKLPGNVPTIAASNASLVPIREAYQMLQANLSHLNSNQEIKVIVVTSSVSQEGKSEVSANLAAVMAQLGRRVLLVDADMRRPKQHHRWRVANAVGLSNILLMGEAQLNQAIQEVMPGLDLLTAGRIPPNPVPLIDSQLMKTLVETFSKSYDFVIFDTPPLSGMADTTLLGRIADGILMVVRPGVVDYASAKAAMEMLRRTGQNVLGIVVNGVNLQNEPNGYFYYQEERYRVQQG